VDLRGKRNKNEVIWTKRKMIKNKRICDENLSK